MTSDGNNRDNKWSNSIDGMRSISHLSLIALHTAMLGTGHLYNKGVLWDSLKNNVAFSVMQAGGVQVDIFFMLSGYLLANQLLRYKIFALPSLKSFVVNRWMRMAPSMLLVLFIGYCIGDVWDPPFPTYDNSTTAFERITAIMMFISNYLDILKYGTFNGTLMWSCAADLQMGTCILLIFIIAFSTFRPQRNNNTDKPANSHAASYMKWIFLLLIIISLVIRGALFNKDVMNLTRLANYFHFISLMTPSAYPFIRDHYNHAWLETEYVFHPDGFEYLNKMYFPSHTRFGPFAVGGLLACNVILAEQSGFHLNASGILSSLYKVLGWVATILALVVIATPCIPAPSETPLEAQFIVTMAIRTISSAAAATLLFRTLVPKSHAWYSPLISTFLGASIWKPLARITFCSYLIHYRVLMELTFNKKIRQLFGLIPPSIADIDGNNDNDESTELITLRTTWICYFFKLYIIGVIVSLLLASVLHYCWEKPWLLIMKRFDTKHASKND